METDRLAAELSMFFDNMPEVSKVTVLMSVYNGESFLRKAIESILNQTYQDIEFVIYDDCSTDSTQRIISSYKDSRICYRRNDSNRGLTFNLADGVNRSEAKYIVRMDADDIAFPERIKSQVEWMNCHPDISIMGTSVAYFCEKPGDCGISHQPCDNEAIKAKLFIDFTLMHPSIIIRRKSLVNHGINYNPEYRYSQDHALYFDCIKAGLKFANLPTPLLYMRAHEGSISRHRHTAQQECSCMARTRFLHATGIGNGLSEDMIAVYNSFASGEFPKSKQDVGLLEQFAIKVCSNPATQNYFDTDVLLDTMAKKLIDYSYQASGHKGLKSAAFKGFNTVLSSGENPIGIKRQIKFLLRLLLKR